MSIVIKPMETDGEIRGKAYVVWKSWHETYPGLVSREYLDTVTLERCTKTAFRRLDKTFVAMDGDRVVGFVGYGAYRGDTLAETGEIYAIYVLEEYHDRKIGYALMNAALEKLRVYPRVAVWVLKGNERAIRFYERVGFRFDGTEEKIELGDMCPELRMILEK